MICECARVCKRFDRLTKVWLKEDVGDCPYKGDIRHGKFKGGGGGGEGEYLVGRGNGLLCERNKGIEWDMGKV